MSILQNDVLEAAARLETETGEDVICVFQFKMTQQAAIPDQAGVDDVLEVLEIIYTVVKVFIAVLSTFRDVTVRNVTQDVVYGSFPWPTLTVGEGASNALPPGVCAFVSFTTAVPRVQLRKYFGNVTTAFMRLNGTFLSTVSTPLTVAAALMLVPFVATNATWTYGHERPLAAGYVVPTGALVTEIPAYQRRRKQGVGS